MTKPQPAAFGDIPVDPAPDTRKWSASHGTYIAGRAYADEADHTAAQLERKWGMGRLRLVVSPELREKFDRQRYKFNHAICHGELEDVRRESQRMVKAWLALDKAAADAGRTPNPPEVWEVVLGGGMVAAIVRDVADARDVQADGRRIAVYTLAEIARLLTASPMLHKAKVVFPGAVVTDVREIPSDPLDGIHETQAALDDPVPF